MTCMLGRHPQISIQCHCSEFVKFGPSYSGWVSVIIVVIASCTNGKNQTEEVEKIARKKRRHQLLEVVACERICLSCWMPWVSPWIADDDPKLGVYRNDDL